MCDYALCMHYSVLQYRRPPKRPKMAQIKDKRVQKSPLINLNSLSNALVRCITDDVNVSECNTLCPCRLTGAP